MTWSELQAKFIDYCTSSNRYSAVTVKHYNRELNSWIKYTGDSTPLECTPEVINAYTHYLKASGLKPASQHAKLTVLRLLIRFAQRVREPLGVYDYDVELPRMKRHIDQYKFLIQSEVEDMLKMCESHLDRAIIYTLWSTGLRISEMLSIPAVWFDGDEEHTIQQVVTGKGDKQRRIFFSPQCLKLIRIYLRKRKGGNTLVFPFGSRYVQYRIKKVGVRALDRPVTPHMLRHSFATYLRTQGVDIRMVQELLGHNSIMTTQIYQHVGEQEMQELHAKLIL